MKPVFFFVVKLDRELPYTGTMFCLPPVVVLQNNESGADVCFLVSFFISIPVLFLHTPPCQNNQK